MATTATRKATAPKPATATVPDRDAYAMGPNVTASVEEGVLYLAIDLAVRGSVSASGKSLMIATTSGNVDIPGLAGGKIGLNAYLPAAQ